MFLHKKRNQENKIFFSSNWIFCDNFEVEVSSLHAIYIREVRLRCSWQLFRHRTHPLFIKRKTVKALWGIHYFSTPLYLNIDMNHLRLVCKLLGQAQQPALEETKEFITMPGTPVLSAHGPHLRSPNQFPSATQLRLTLWIFGLIEYPCLKTLSFLLFHQF